MKLRIDEVPDHDERQYRGKHSAAAKADAFSSSSGTSEAVP
jgi:hypothetical protein